eukprot:gene7855-8705_t
MLSGSTQSRFWTFSSKEKLVEHRNKAWQRYADGIAGEFTQEQILNCEEQTKTLDYYASIIIQLCNQFQPPSPPTVYGTALMYFKRFYINTSPMEYHPKELMYLCIYLAAKVDEYNVSIVQFIQQLAPTYNNVGEFIISNELLLMQKLHFHLTVHNAYRPMEGFLLDIKTRCKELEDPEQYRPKTERFIVRALITDAFLLYTPSQVALAALRYSMGSLLDDYVDNAFGGQNENIAKLHNKLADIIQLVDEFSLPDKDKLDEIKRKLSQCRNQEHNPLSEHYQAKKEKKKILKHEMKQQKMAKERADHDNDNDSGEEDILI